MSDHYRSRLEGFEAPTAGAKHDMSPVQVVQLIDRSGLVTGSRDSQLAHRQGDLHEAFSVAIFDSRGRMLLQRRSPEKIRFPSLWTNACCSHTRAGVPILDGARERLVDEMGFQVPLLKVASFVYRARDEASGLIEHEFDHVLVGRFDGDPVPDPREASEARWMGWSSLLRDLAANPKAYTPWFPRVVEALETAVTSSSP
jgi:isopentenyl-diphosphate Delta-isomerase